MVREMSEGVRLGRGRFGWHTYINIIYFYIIIIIIPNIYNEIKEQNEVDLL